MHAALLAPPFLVPILVYCWVSAVALIAAFVVGRPARQLACRRRARSGGPLTVHNRREFGNVVFEDVGFENNR